MARLVQKRKSFHNIYLPFLSFTPLFELSVLMNLNTWLILSTAVDTIRQKSTLSCMHSPFAPLPQYTSSTANKLYYGRYANNKCGRRQCPQGIYISANSYKQSLVSSCMHYMEQESQNFGFLANKRTCYKIIQSTPIAHFA